MAAAAEARARAETFHKGLASTLWTAKRHIDPPGGAHSRTTSAGNASRLPRGIPRLPGAAKTAGPVTRRHFVWSCWAPLIGQLSNPDIQKQLSRLCRYLEQAMVGNGSVVRERHACRCGCEREVAQPRKFVDQAHYDRWRA